jgi:hypothetical protein
MPSYLLSCKKNRIVCLEEEVWALRNGDCQNEIAAESWLVVVQDHFPRDWPSFGI